LDKHGFGAGGALVSQPSTLFSTQGSRPDIAAAVQPRGQDGVSGEGGRFPCHIREDHLGYFLGTVVVSVHLPKRSRIDEIDMAPDQFRERGLGTVCGVAAEKFCVICHFTTARKPGPLGPG
jgi:hypothetical protein